MSEITILNNNNNNTEPDVNYIIGKLPVDIVNLIYINYVNPDIICIKLYTILSSIESTKLNSIPLENFLRKHVLQNDIVIKYLIKNDKIFENIYNTHIIQGNQIFTSFPDIVSSLAMCWIMYLYH